MNKHAADETTDLLSVFNLRSAGNQSDALHEMLTLKKILDNELRRLDSEIARGEREWRESANTGLNLSDYSAVAEHLKSMCPQTTRNSFGLDGTTSEFMSNASEDVPWLRPLMKNGVFQPPVLHDQSVQLEGDDPSKCRDFEDEDDYASGVHAVGKSAPSTAASTPRH